MVVNTDLPLVATPCWATTGHMEPRGVSGAPFRPLGKTILEAEGAGCRGTQVMTAFVYHKVAMSKDSQSWR